MPAHVQEIDPNWLAQIPPVPRTPSRAARRVIFGYGGEQGIQLLVGGGFALLGTIFTLVFCWGMPADIAIDVSRISRTANVTDTERLANVEINEVHPWAIHYTYVVDGTTYEGASMTTDGSLVDSAASRSRIAIEAAAIHPAWSRVKGTTRSVFGYITCFVLLFPGIGIALLWWAIRANRREVRAYTWGVPALAEVTSAGLDTSCSSNGQHPYKVAWEFKVEDAVYSGSISSMRRMELEDLARQKMVPVLYDPENPDANTVYIA